MSKSNKSYKAACYLRLSKEDGDFSISPGKMESNSISGQRNLIESFARQQPEITLVDEFCDDGYTGTNFDRPAFTRMIEAVKQREINCIIVKDLSRFGRDYIEAGKYIEKVFPLYGVRFIAINDHYDSLDSAGGIDNIIVPFKNLINDSYSRDISIKVRSSLNVKRNRGEFIANYPVYGYRRSEEDKNKLIVDDYPAGVVRDIFKWYIGGISPSKIAERLNGRGDPAPAEYKHSTGSKYATSFKRLSQSLWGAVTVMRILSNEVYTGDLVQGKRTTPNYKVKRVIVKQESDWVRAENTHDGIVSRGEFDLVQMLLREKKRSAPGEDCIPIFSGKIYCAHCNAPAKRQTVPYGDKKYVYYICSNSKPKNECQKHRISEIDLKKAVLATLQAQISTALDIGDALKKADSLTWEQHEINKIKVLIAMQEEVIVKNKNLIFGIYEDCKDGIITSEEFGSMKQEFSIRMETAEKTIQDLECDLRNIKDGLENQKGWLEQFRKYHNIQELSRTVVVCLVERINLFADRQIEVVFRHQNHFTALQEFSQQQQPSSVKEAV